jgi:gliding motility-associated-like protein
MICSIRKYQFKTSVGKQLLPLIIFLFIPFIFNAQLVVTPNNNAAQLAQNLVGQGVIVSNAQLFAANTSTGTFTATNTNLGLYGGVILSSGKAASAPGPNSAPGTTTAFSTPGYPLLTAIAGVATKDRCVLQFDVIPLADTMRFRYVFGSEEYPEYVNQFNDAFGFFVSGPNPAGGSYIDKNVALIPNTSTIVSINNVNANVNSQYYVNNNGPTPNNPSYPIVGSTIEYDGFTARLEVVVAVVACQSYTLKLAVADAVDRLYDSSVFLEENSLSSSGFSITAKSNSPTFYNNLVEGCLDGVVTIKKLSNDSTSKMVFLSTAGTATEGTDYNSLPDTVIFQGTTTSINIPLIGIVDNITEGTETIKIYLKLGCSATVVDSVEILINDYLPLDVTPDTTICNGTTIQLRAKNAQTYTWTPSTGLSNPFNSLTNASPTQTTTYTVLATLGNCMNSDTVRVTVFDYPVVELGPDTSLCIGTYVQLNPNISPGATIVWTPGTGIVPNGVPNPIINPFVTTTYVVKATNGNMCSNYDTVTITVNPIPYVNAGQDIVLCEGEQVQLQAFGTASYQWSPAGSLSDPNISNPVASPTATTIYTVSGMDSTGCSKKDQVKVTVVPKPSVKAGNDQTICFGDTTTLNGSGAIQYSWTPNSNQISDTARPDPMVWPAQTGNFIVKGTDLNGCSANDTVKVTVLPNPATTTTGYVIVCPGAPATLNASGGTTYQWIPASGLSNPNIFNPTATVNGYMVYSVIVTDSNGCRSLDSVIVDNHTLPTVNAGQGDSICIGGSTQLNASNGASFLWSPAGSLSNPTSKNPVANPSTTTTYTLNVTDNNGCSNTDSITVTVLPLPNANAGSDKIVCEKSSVQLNASGGANYLWSPATNLSCTNCPDPVVTPTTNTSYEVWVTDQYGCKRKDSINITVIPLPTITLTPGDTGICPGQSVLIQVTGGLSYAWEPTPGLSNYNAPNTLASPATTSVYTVHISDITGCVATDSIKITVYPLPNVSTGKNDSLCFGTSIQLHGSGAVNYFWQPAIGLNNPTIANPVANPKSNTVYTLTGTDTRGCINTDQIAITVLPLPTANAGQDRIVCEDDIIALSGSGGNTYAWSPSTGLTCSNCSNPFLRARRSRNYVLTVKDQFGCADQDTVFIFVNPKPLISIKNDTSICPFTQATLMVSGGVSYQWFPPTGLSDPKIANPVANPNQTTIYSVIVTDTKGCTNTDSIKITVFPDIRVNAGADTSICYADQFMLNATGVSKYTWTPPTGISDPNIPNPIAAPKSTTVYTVAGIDLNGCPSSDQVTITVNPLPVIQLSVHDTTICPNVTLPITASGGILYQWSPAAGLDNPNSPAPIASPTQNTVYTLLVTDLNRCFNRDTLNLKLYPVTDPNARPASQSICPGIPLQLNAENGVKYDWQPAQYLDNNQIANPVTTPYGSLTYTLTIEDKNGCIFKDWVDINVFPAAHADAGMDQSVFIGNSTNLEGSGNGRYLWTPAKWLSDPNMANPVTTPDSSITYVLEITTDNGCKAYDSVYIRVYYETKVYMPNAFTPNGDGKNDTYGPEWYHEFEVAYFRIFNRWGEMIFETTDPNHHWDGTVDGIPQPIGSYVYILRGWGNRDEAFFQQGQFTLIR